MTKTTEKIKPARPKTSMRKKIPSCESEGDDVMRTDELRPMTSSVNKTRLKKFNIMFIYKSLTYKILIND